MTLTHFQKWKIGFAFVLLGVIPLWSLWVVPELEKLPPDFSYQADIFSMDNFYDEAHQQFLGETISKTRFSYETVSRNDDIEVLSVKNIFDVRSITGEKIFTVERHYGVDARTGKHLQGYGDKDREGYLFAPRHPDQQDYVYWHINYDTPATMKFQEETELLGLKVYRSQCDYQADQTENLKHLPGVPETRGVQLDINLQTWIEPVSGRMVKYEDKTTAYYYNRKTGARLHPWNKFNNTYTNPSIAEQVHLAQNEKLKILWLERGVPGILAIMALLLFALAYLESQRFNHRFKQTKKIIKKRLAKTLLGGAALGAVLLGGIMIIFRYDQTETKPVTIGIAQWVTNPEYTRNVEGFKAGLAEEGFVEGAQVQFLLENPDADIQHQREIINSFVQAEVDLIYSLTTPGTLIAKSLTNRIPIVFSIVTYPVRANVIESLRSSKNNLVGTRNYIPPSRQYYTFERIYPHTRALAVVHRKGEPNSIIQANELKSILEERGIRVLAITGVDLADLRACPP